MMPAPAARLPSADVEQALAAAEREPGYYKPKKLRYTHEALIDQIIASPGISQNELAAMFGYTAAWISVVMSTDMFKAKLAERREEIVDPAIRATVLERAEAVTKRSLDVLMEKLAKEPSQVSDQLALKGAELGLKALGVGGNAPPPPPPADHLAGLANRLVGLLGTAKGNSHVNLPVVEVVEVESRPLRGADRREGPGEANAPDAGEAHPAAEADGDGQ